MKERNWRPGEPAERAHEGDRVQWHQEIHASRVETGKTKDELFMSEEARAFDRGTVANFDQAKDSWHPHQPAVPDYDLSLREENGPKPGEPG